MSVLARNDTGKDYHFVFEGGKRKTTWENGTVRALSDDELRQIPMNKRNVTGEIIILTPAEGTGSDVTVLNEVEIKNDAGNPIPVSGSFSADPPAQLTLRMDEAGSLTYVGEATPGSTESAASWRIKRIDESAAPDTTILWADGNANFDNVWSDRTTLTYA